jgi:hypothetical protein
MRTKQDFKKIVSTCEAIFGDSVIKGLKIRYFDPTNSAAFSTEDKGLIECLMVKCCKVLIYCAGDQDSYGKDAEAAMALSLGKPVIFLCEDAEKQDFFRDVHPLTRLIDFSTGVANGAMVAKDPKEVSVLLNRLFKNNMQYDILQKEPGSGYYILQERLTKSTVRLQTSDTFLSNAFWIYR